MKNDSGPDDSIMQLAKPDPISLIFARLHVVFGENGIRWNFSRPLRPPARILDSGRIQKSATVAKLCGSGACCVVGFSSSRTSIFVDPATDIFPVGVSLLVALQSSEHDVDKLNAGLGYIEANNCVPPTVAIVRFPALANLDGGLNFETLLRSFADQVRVALVMVMLEHRALIHRVSEHVRDQPAEVISLN